MTNAHVAALDRDQTRGEEIANSISHGVGFAAVLAVTPPLIIHAMAVGQVPFIVGVSVFAGSAAILYLSSTLYHALPPGQAKRVFQVIEHSAIFLLIAGTYTPFMLGALRGPWGWTLVSLIWCLAVLGVLLKTVGRQGPTVLSLVLYLAMGWLVMVAIRPLWLHVPRWGLGWLLAGGLAYTVGTLFFVADRVRYAHFTWHLFVLTGTACHFVAVWFYAA